LGAEEGSGPGKAAEYVPLAQDVVKQIEQRQAKAILDVRKLAVS
jgi:hypothetical protein